MHTTKSVLWIDLDGTVRWGKDELGHFVNTPSDVRVFDEIPAIFKAYKNAGWRIVGVTNQGGVAMGHMTLETATECNWQTYLQCDELFDKIAMCVHHPDSSDPMMGNCWCRKPRIGMLVSVGIELSQKTSELYPPHLGLFVGDRPEDEQCAENAGLPFMWATEWRSGGWRKWL